MLVIFYLQKEIVEYFQYKMPRKINADISILKANLYDGLGDFKKNRIERVRDWFNSAVVYTDGFGLYNRYAKNREIIYANQYKQELLGELAGYI